MYHAIIIHAKMRERERDIYTYIYIYIYFSLLFIIKASYMIIYNAAPVKGHGKNTSHTVTQQSLLLFCIFV